MERERERERERENVCVCVCRECEKDVSCRLLNTCADVLWVCVGLAFLNWLPDSEEQLQCEVSAKCLQGDGSVAAAFIEQHLVCVFGQI